MTALRLYSPPFTPLSLFDVLHNPAFGIIVFGGKEMRRNDSFISPGRGIEIPADPLIEWLILHILPGSGARLRLLGLLGGAWWAGHHLSRCGSAWRQKGSYPPLGKCTQASSYSHVTADKELQGQRGEMRTGQACQSSNYFTPRGNKAPASGVFASSGVLRVSVSYENFPQGRYIYTHQNFCDCFGSAISKRQCGGRWLSAAVRGAEIDTQ